MSQNYIKKKLVRGVNNSKVAEGERVVFGGRLYYKHNGGLKRASDEETREFIKEHTQKREQAQ